MLVDSNLLIYAHVTQLPQSEKARLWLENVLNETPRIGLPWPSLLSFIRIVSNPRIFERAETVSRAWAQVEEWLDLPAVWIPEPMEQHAEILGRLLQKTGNRSNLVPDAHLAALAMEHGLTLYSTDGDFARFAGLRWENPL